MDERKKIDSSFQRNKLFHLDIARVLTVSQQVGNNTEDKRLVCRLEMALGGIVENVPFSAGGVDYETEFPHGVFVPPRREQLVGVLFLRGRWENPVACFPIPQPSWELNEVEGKKLFSEIMEDLDDITIFHFSGSRIYLRKDGKIEIGMMINDELSTLIIEFKKGEISVEQQSGGKLKINSGNDSTIELGQGALEALVKSDSFKSVFNSHTHTTPVGPSGPPITLMTDSVATTKVKGA